jgi:hypothetical protein
MTVCEGIRLNEDTNVHGRWSKLSKGFYEIDYLIYERLKGAASFQIPPCNNGRNMRVGQKSGAIDVWISS